VIDEALAVGDFLFQQKCNKFLKENFSGITKLLVTHDMAAVANLADRALVLHHGEIVYEGDPQSAIREYQIVARAEESRKILRVNQDINNLEVNRVVSSSKTGRPVRPSREWIDVPESRLSGTLRVKIRQCCWEINGDSNPVAIRDGEKIRIEFDVTSQEPIENPIVGYQVLDRFGNVVFGENSTTSRLTAGMLPAGSARLSLEFEWPRIAPDKYAITLGIGSGYDSLAHTIECWAHNVFVLSATASVPVHGMFNVQITGLTVGEVL
jgi:hypothetical protein